ncbi:MAG: hypothetical protein AAGU75_08715 [Bacillota bacterium]
MKGELEVFAERIDNFESLTAGEQIPFFTYFLSGDGDKDVSPGEIRECFTLLSLAPYSNIAAFLGRKSTGRDAIFFKTKSGYHLTRNAKKDIAAKINEVITSTPTSDLISLSIVSTTRDYITEVARQMCCCYDKGLYDACFVMMRKLLESLIVECFERHGASDEIKDGTKFYYLSDLIPSYLNSEYWNTSPNLQTNIAKIKEYGDLSAHNRRFLAQKEHIDRIKSGVEQVIQEIVLTINYPQWNEELKSKKKV